MSFSDKLDRMADMHDWEREYYDWLKLPPWVRYEDSNDRIAGLDTEPAEPHSYPKIKGSTPEIRKIFKLMDSGLIPY